MRFEVYCDNKKSYNIVAIHEQGRLLRSGKPCILVRCDRTDPVENQRGLALANKITSFLNTLPHDEAVSLLSAGMLPS